MNLKSFSDELLHESTLSAACEEKRATLRLLEFLAEVDARRLYAARGFSSLWEYVHLALGYSESQASERVSAMRLMRKVPEVREMLSANKLTLTSTAKLASFVRRENCSPEKTNEILGMIAEKSVREVERVLSSEQTIPAPRPDAFKPQGLASTRISFDADAEFLALYEELKNVQGRPDWEMNERFKDAIKAVLTKKKRDFPSAGRNEVSKSVSTEPADGLPRGKDGEIASEERSVTSSPERSTPVLRAQKVTLRQKEEPASEKAKVQNSQIPERRSFPAFVLRAVRMRSGHRCEYVDQKTGRRCTSRFALEFDHIVPFAKGGASILENCRHLCAAHNRFAAVREFGSAKMEKHLRM
jgi:5-methylcytosine-specific restriction endonuclease McrA